MPLIGLPLTTKRSLRFKRYSWNVATDGSFPPIAKRCNSSTPITEPVGLLASSNGIVSGQTEREQSDKKPKGKLHSVKQPASNDTTSSSLPTSDSTLDKPQNTISGTTLNPQTLSAPTDPTIPNAASLTKKKNNKQHGKKRKSVYLGPSWDDTAGQLPTATTTDDMDFDSLLSQMVGASSGKEAQR